MIQQIFKRVPFGRLLVTCLVGVFFLVSAAACSATNAASPTKGTPISSSQQGRQYSPSQQGQGMYPHKDTERDTTRADAKADRLVQQAEEKRQKIKGPGDYLDEAASDTSVGRAAQNVADNTQKSFNKLKQNAENAVDRVANPS